MTSVFVAIGKAIAAYERTFRVAPNALDAYASGKESALTAEQKQGLVVFSRVGCTQCHWGPRLTDDAFHVTHLPTGRRDGAADRGRWAGLPLLHASEFLTSSPWSDAAPRGSAPASDAPSPSMIGAFKTPPLRGVASAAPFGHGGTEGSLIAVTRSYGSGGLATEDPRTAGVTEPWLARFDEVAQWALVPFLETLTADPLVR